MENCRTKQAGLSILSLLIAGAVLMTAPVTVWAGHFGGETGHTGGARKAEDVRNTLHNLSTSNIIAGTNIGAGTSPTSEVCVFCHTPHGADASFKGAPLWNRALPSGASYTTYSSPNFDMGTAGQPVGVSLACLSCHDGTAALDAFINGPGSGKYYGGSAGNMALDRNAVALAAGFGSGGDDSMGEGVRTDTGTNYGTILTGAAPFPNLTTNLSDDHPISFPMQQTVNGDPQFDDVNTFTAAGNVTLISRTGTAVPLDRRDAIRLYPASGAAGPAPTSATDGWVECASCHNPHAPRPLMLRLANSTTAYTSGGGSAAVADDPNAGSAVCLSCHEK